MKKVLLAIILLIAFSSVANAECAWVLWLKVSKNPLTKEGKWELTKAFQTYQQCQEYKNEAINGSAENFKRNKGWDVKVYQSESILVSDSAKNESIFLEYSCFPDTIDPRK
jgi:hypothetical protein